MKTYSFEGEVNESSAHSCLILDLCLGCRSRANPLPAVISWANDSLALTHNQCINYKKIIIIKKPIRSGNLSFFKLDTSKKCKLFCFSSCLYKLLLTAFFWISETKTAFWILPADFRAVLLTIIAVNNSKIWTHS